MKLLVQHFTAKKRHRRIQTQAIESRAYALKNWTLLENFTYVLHKNDIHRNIYKNLDQYFRD